jgi:hypothetical protein
MALFLSLSRVIRMYGSKWKLADIFEVPEGEHHETR